MQLRTWRMKTMMTTQPEASSNAQLHLEHLGWHCGDCFWKQGDLNNKIPFFLAADGRHRSWVTSLTHLLVTLEQINETTLTARRQMSFGVCIFFPSIFRYPKYSDTRKNTQRFVEQSKTTEWIMTYSKTGLTSDPTGQKRHAVGDKWSTGPIVHKLLVSLPTS